MHGTRCAGVRSTCFQQDERTITPSRSPSPARASKKARATGTGSASASASERSATGSVSGTSMTNRLRAATARKPREDASRSRRSQVRPTALAAHQLQLSDPLCVRFRVVCAAIYKRPALRVPSVTPAAASFYARRTYGPSAWCSTSFARAASSSQTARTGPLRRRTRCACATFRTWRRRALRS